MLVATHLMIGGSLGLLIAPGHPFLVFIVAFVTHFLIDVIPHGDADLYDKYLQGQKVLQARLYVALDVVASALLLAFLLTRPFDPGVREMVIWGLAGGILPDILVGVYEQFQLKTFARFHAFHLFFHNLATKRMGDISFFGGIVMQVMMIGGLGWVF